MAAVDLDNETIFTRVNGMDIYMKQGHIQANRPIIIPEGYRVHFEPGTTLDLTDSAMFISYSPVFMRGQKDHPIVVTSSDFSANGFTVLQAGVRSVLDNVIFENLNTLNYKGWMLTGAVTFYESDVDISNTMFYRNQCEDALNTVRSGFSLENAKFEHIYGDAFDSDFCTGRVANTSFTNIGNDAIDFSGSHIQIIDTDITEVEDKGISGGEGSDLTVINTTILRANIGVASKDLSTVTLRNSLIKDCNYGLVLLQKKPEYGPASMELVQTKIEQAKTPMLIEKGSVVTIDGKIYEGDKTDVSSLFY